MSGWTPWRRGPAPIRSLCDETPTWPQKSPQGTVRPPLITEQQQTPPPPIAEPGRWQPRQAPMHTPGSTYEAVEREYARLSLAAAEANQRADALAARLRHRTQLLAAFLPADAVAELERADRQWIGDADTVAMPRVRSYPGPGPSIDVTRPGDDGDLLMGRPW